MSKIESNRTRKALFNSSCLAVMILVLVMFSLNISTSGQARGWGRNNLGQLGLGNFDTPQLSPMALGNSGNITGISAGEFFTLFLKADGTVAATGDNTTGQLGDGTQSIRNSPVAVVNLSNVVAISASQLHSLALLADGTMMAWGRNAEGQLGNGGGGVGQSAVAPMPVINLTSVTAIASGGIYSLALKSDGTVWAWGSNSDGQLGNGTTPNSNPHGTPTQVGAGVAGFNNIIAIAAGVNHGVALKSDGTVWVWGSNVFGEIGNGASGGNQLVPVQNSALSGVSQITAGWHFTHALKTDGTVFTWGYNVRGNIGNGTTNSTGCQCNPTPAQTSITNVVDIKTSDQHTLARKSDGTVWAWGWNLYGQLGNGATITTGCQCLSSPVQVTALGAGNSIIAAGYFHSFAAVRRHSWFDFDGDGKTDISIFRPAPAEWWYLKSSDGGNSAAQFGQTTDKIVPGDFTGDGKTDIAIWRPSTGFWFILRSEDSSFFSFPFGTAGDIPTPADYDGDGKTDPAVFRPSNSTWFIQQSGGGGTAIGQFGQTGDIPVTADYDGDGKSDIAIFRPNGSSGAEWWYRKSSNNQVAALQFGAASDKAVPGDFTGDGKTDIAVWRPSSGYWFILRSEDFSFFSFPFGTNGDVPAPGDYDGDGKFDAAVFRPSNATWFVNRSTAGVLIQPFGITGDLPVPGVFVAP